jgi:hypothetical protein
MNATKTTPAVAAITFLNACDRAGWKVTIKEENIVTITKHFAPNDRAAFVACDGEYYGLLSILPHRGGSVWGTDGGSVGGYSAMLHGEFRMNVSGVSKVAMRTLYGVTSAR